VEVIACAAIGCFGEALLVAAGLLQIISEGQQAFCDLLMERMKSRNARLPSVSRELSYEKASYEPEYLRRLGEIEA